MRHSIKTSPWPLLPLLVAVSGTSFANHEYRSEAGDYARVTHVEPIIRYVEVSTPRQECWREPVRHIETRNDYTTGRTILGGLIGAAVGHQIGHGRGKDAATVVGGLAGAAIGANSARDDSYREEHVDYEDRCRTTYTRHEEERVEGYDVTYVYGGREYTTVTAEHPGKRIPVNVHVSPVYRPDRPY